MINLNTYCLIMQASFPMQGLASLREYPTRPSYSSLKRQKQKSKNYWPSLVFILALALQTESTPSLHPTVVFTGFLIQREGEIITVHSSCHDSPKNETRWEWIYQEINDHFPYLEYRHRGKYRTSSYWRQASLRFRGQNPESWLLA